MNEFVMIIFIFAMGSIFGWVLEVFYRRLTDKNKNWTNPGFCVGPWLPIYGIAIVIVFLITYLNDNDFIGNIYLRRIVLFIFIGLFVTLLELISGALLLKLFNMRFWDYRDEKFNFKGFICLKYTFYWILLASIYYFIIHPKIYGSVVWLSNNLAFSFFVGSFFSLFVMDVIYSSNVIARLRQYAIDNNIIVKFEDIKNKIISERKKINNKSNFFVFMLRDNIKEILIKSISDIKHDIIQ